jgi:sporulation protein YlmC with PRC-barrel domain
MRLSDLLRSEVVAEDGTRLGRVRDVRLVRDGHELPGFGPSYRVHDLFVGKNSLGARLGLDRPHVHSPWILRVLFGRHMPEAIPWSSVVTVGEGRIRVRRGPSRES